MKILISDPIEQRCVDILSAEGFAVDLKPGVTSEQLKTVIGGYDALIVRGRTRVTAELLRSADLLKVVGRAGTGVDNIDVEAATRKGVIVMNTPGGNAISTAEHTFSLLLALARNIPEAHTSLKQGMWERKKFIGTELFGKTIGIIGLGKVGREVARRCLSFGMIVVGYDPVLSIEVALKLGIELADLEDVLRRSDFISLHTPLTEETRNLLNEHTIGKCKKGVRIINCARGGIVDEEALLKALESGHVAGAALDVFEKEPPTNDRLIRHEKLVVTPHLGASTEEAQEKVAILIAEQIVDLLKGRGFAGVVNAVAIQQAMKEEIKPYVTLAEKLGSLVAQLMKGKLRSVTLTYGGELLQQAAEILSAATLKGVLGHLHSEPVNYVNAPVLARELGLIVNEKKERDSGSYTHLLELEYETDRERRKFSGTVFGTSTIRLVNIDGFHFEVRPEGHLLFYSNIDRPGMLASVGSMLAQAGINIAGVALGRAAIGERALTVMNVDSGIPDTVVKEISSIEGVYEANFVRL